MTRNDLISVLTDHPEIRVWQAIRNLSPYAFIYGSDWLPPARGDYDSDEAYTQACIHFAENVKDTFYIPDSQESNE